jgi:autotransporter-associated beta strand protein
MALVLSAERALAIAISDVKIVAPADPNAVGRYTKLELLVTLSEVSATKFYNFDPADGGLDLVATFSGPGITRTIYGFYDGAAWRVRFSPTVLGAWTFSLAATDSSGSGSWNGGSFRCAASGYPGFVQINGKYFQHSDGSRFFGIGHNNGWQTAAPDIEQPSLADMVAQGENLLSFWMATPWSHPEWGGGHDVRAPLQSVDYDPNDGVQYGLDYFNQKVSAYLDGVIERAEAANAYLLPTIWAHDQICNEGANAVPGHATGPSGWPSAWNNNPYKDICLVQDFFQLTSGASDTPQWKYQKRLYRYIVARWAHSRAIIGWVAMDEIDGTTADFVNPANTQPWCVAVRDFFRARDLYRLNASNQYPMAVSKTDKPAFDPGLDLRADDSYTSQALDVDIGGTLAGETLTMTGNGTPGFNGEFGGYISGGATQPRHLHNGIWGATAAGAALSPLQWCDNGGWPMLTDPTYGPGMRTHLGYLSRFLSGVDFHCDPSCTSFNVIDTATQKCWATMLGTSPYSRGMAWVQNPLGNVDGQALTIGNMAAGNYAVWWFDGWTGTLTRDGTTYTVRATGGNKNELNLTVPSISQGDVALKFIRIVSGSAPTIAIWDGGGLGQAWSDAFNWDQDLEPVSGTTTQLTLPNLGPTPYTANNDAAFNLNALSVATLYDGSSIAGSALRFGGSNPAISQNGAGAFSVSAPLTLNATTGIAGSGSGVLTLGGNITGSGGLDKYGSCVISLDGSNTYSGSTTIAGGTLRVNGSISSATTVQAGGTLRGTGSMAGISSFGIVWPGASTNASDAKGQLQCASADFSGGGTLKVRASNSGVDGAVSADSISVSGGVTLGGSSTLQLQVSISPGTYSVQQDIVLLSATGGISGIFANVTTERGPLTGTGVSIIYTATQVILRVNAGVITPATIGLFSAYAQAGGVLVDWECESEYQNAGFNIWRQNNVNASWDRVNGVLIPGRLTTSQPQAYRFLDAAGKAGDVYRLETVSISGERQFHAVLATADGQAAPPTTTRDISANERFVDDCSAPGIAVAGTRMRGSRTTLPYASVLTRRVQRDALKVTSRGSGVLFVAQKSLPPGFSAREVTVLYEGKKLVPLSAAADGLALFAPGYEDEYTDKDAFFLLKGHAESPAMPPRATGLFDQAEAPVVTTEARARKEFYDVYFDWNLQPYTYAPWFSSKYLIDGSRNQFQLPVNNLADGAATLRLELWSQSAGAHTLQVLINGVLASEQTWSGSRALVLNVDVPAGLLQDGVNDITLITPDLGAAQLAFLHAIDLQYQRRLCGPGPLSVVVPPSVAALGRSDSRVQISDLSTGELWVVDVGEQPARRPAPPARLVSYQSREQGGGKYEARFRAKGGRKYLVVERGAELLPVAVEQRTLQPVPRAEYLAVGPARFRDATRPLLDQHARERLRAAFVDQEALFDYYGYGRYGPDAIRTGAHAAGAKFLLLVGRTTYDYHDREKAGVDPLCPSFFVSTEQLSLTVSDAKFADFGKGYPQICVGRLPVNTEDELRVAVARTLAHCGLLSSGNRGFIVADRADGAGGDFAAQSEAITNVAPEFIWSKAYLGVTHAESADVGAALSQAASGSAGLVVFNGHGNSRVFGLGLPRILDQTSMQSWTGNVVLLQATCNGNWFARNERDYRSLAIQGLTQPQGGIAASISTTTYMESSKAVEFMQALLRNLVAPASVPAGPTLLSGKKPRWGEVLLKAQRWAKQQSVALKAGPNYYRDLMWTECLLGDPALPVFAKDQR